MSERFTRSEKDRMQDAVEGLQEVVIRLSADLWDHNYRASVMRAEILLRDLLKG